MGTINSCCCCSLAQGTVGAGVYSAIESVVTLIRGGTLLRKWRELQDGNIVHDSIGVLEKYDQNQLKSVYRTFGWGYVIIGAIYLLLSVLIFVGVSLRRRNYLVPWLVCTAISCVLIIISVFFNISSGLLDPVVFARVIIELAIMGYLYIVVHSYYISLQQPSVYPATISTNNQTLLSQSRDPEATGYTTETSNYKSDLPAYPEVMSNTTYVNNSTPYAAAYSNFPPPPSYFEATKSENN